MKRSLMALALVAALTVSASAQTKETRIKEKNQKSEVKKKNVHSCSSACKDGNHIYIHGEEGHACGKECKKTLEALQLKILTEKKDDC